MDWYKLKMPQSVFDQLTPEQRHLIELSDVEPDDFDYSEDEIHRELKSVSTKAFKALKKREYELRHNLK
jgi:hypothetical protein